MRKIGGNLINEFYCRNKINFVNQKMNFNLFAELKIDFFCPHNIKRNGPFSVFFTVFIEK